MQIGELARRVGLTTRTIRYYEELGIIEPEERSSGGFRLYSEEQARRLEIIQSLKALGFELDRIRALFELKNRAATGGDLAMAVVDALLQQQERIDARLEEYRRMQAANRRAIEILQGCTGCARRLGERDCRACEVYQRHPAIPDVVECALCDHRVNGGVEAT
jgi:MerR family Zn(II)-responsive transcriptional regulator of zntA